MVLLLSPKTFRFVLRNIQRCGQRSGGTVGVAVTKVKQLDKALESTGCYGPPGTAAPKGCDRWNDALSFSSCKTVAPVACCAGRFRME
jgi:hypothetical protein